jgi:nitronate monooxygenase
MGADFGYIGSAFIATEEARASDAYIQAIVDNDSDEIVYSNLFTGVHGNYLAPSIRNAGMDPADLAVSDPSKMDFGGASAKAWKDIWGCGQGIGAVTQLRSTAAYVAQLKREYAESKAKSLAQHCPGDFLGLLGYSPCSYCVRSY